MATVGVLALQGGFALHRKPLEALGHSVVEVRTAEELARVDGLVLPGGESTAMLRLIARGGLEGPLRSFVASGKPVLATCAGLILAAKKVVGPEQPSLGFLDVCVARNAFGRQLDSFEGTADGVDLPLVFIRAPRIVEWSKDVEVKATLDREPVLVKQRNVTGATFHPELTHRLDVHRGVFSEA